MIKKIISKFENFFFEKREFNKIISEFRKLTSENKVLIIGNSSEVLNHERQKIINKFNYVVRFNGAPIIKYEKNVGNNLNMVSINQNIFEQQFVSEDIEQDYVSHLSNKDIFVVLEKNINNQYDFNKINSNNKLIFFKNNLNHYLRFSSVSNYNIIKKIYFYLYGKKFSMGMIVILLFLKAKYEVFIIGFDLEKKVSNYTHYYSKNKINYNSSHDWFFENNFIKKLLRTKAINLLN